MKPLHALGVIIALGPGTTLAAQAPDASVEQPAECVPLDSVAAGSRCVLQMLADVTLAPDERELRLWAESWTVVDPLLILRAGPSGPPRGGLYSCEGRPVTPSGKRVRCTRVALPHQEWTRHLRTLDSLGVTSLPDQADLELELRLVSGADIAIAIEHRDGSAYRIITYADPYVWNDDEYNRRAAAVDRLVRGLAAAASAP